jgi:type II secretory pathway component PulJ
VSRMKRHLPESGISLAEILIAMALMGMVLLMISNFLFRGGTANSSLEKHFEGAVEIQSAISAIQNDLHQGAYISNNSYDKRLEYTTYDSAGNAVKKIYRINSSSNLELSLDGGTSWISPYAISNATKYQISGKFLYAWPNNNCTDFVDTNSNGVWLSGEDATYASGACANDSGPALSSPSQATKVDLKNFVFTGTSGNPLLNYALTPDLFINVGTGFVRSATAPASPAVKDPLLVQSFDTATANSLYGTGFDVRGLTWDASRDRLVLVGQHSSGSNIIYLADRDGVIIGPNIGLTTSTTTLQLDGVAFDADNTSVFVLSQSGKKIYKYNTAGSTPLVPILTFDLASPSNLINTPKSIAYDPSTPNDIYIVGADISTGAYKIYEYNYTTRALVGSALALPAAFDATHPPSGLAIEPDTGDFLLVRNYVNGAAPNQTLDIYRLTRAGGSSSFSVNVSDLSTSATTTTGNWGLAFDAATNRLFLSDSATDKVYEIVPSVMISPMN